LVSLVLADSKLFFLATIYALLGIPLSYLIWYRPLYRAMRYAIPPFSPLLTMNGFCKARHFNMHLLLFQYLPPAFF
jgi:hypothetical protein